MNNHHIRLAKHLFLLLILFLIPKMSTATRFDFETQQNQNAKSNNRYERKGDNATRKFIRVFCSKFVDYDMQSSEE